VRYCKIISLLARMAGKVDFTPKFLPLICQIRTVAKVAIPLSMLHRIMHV